uniref:WH2 domain-containing protein n=1 Tax=Gopherus evgoodei TaxID=1825980 RepID=A0A8C4YL87_9SAUR
MGVALPPPKPAGGALGRANSELPKLSREEQRGRGALLQDICKGPRLRKNPREEAVVAPALLPSSPKAASSKGASLSSDPSERRTTQVPRK